MGQKRAEDTALKGAAWRAWAAGPPLPAKRPSQLQATPCILAYSHSLKSEASLGLCLPPLTPHVRCT